MHVTQVFLEPLDTLFFRDGRPFGQGDHARGGLPTPQTLAGALRTHALRRAGFSFPPVRGKVERSPRELLLEHGAAAWAVDLEVRGPLVAVADPQGAVARLFPAPADLRRPKGAAAGEAPVLRRLDPAPSDPPIPGWTDAARRPLWYWGDEALEPVSGFLTEAGATTWLGGGVPAAQDLVALESLIDFETRTGLAIGPRSLTAEEGLLYSVRLLRAREDVVLEGPGLRGRAGFWAEVRWPGDGPPPEDLLGGRTTLRWGGESRRVLVHLVDPRPWPEVSLQDARVQTRWLLTPAPFAGGPGHPDRDRHLIAAAVGSVEAISGWDLARHCPKPNRFAAGAGSVFFFEPGHEEALLEDAEARAQGYGLELRGKISP